MINQPMESFDYYPVSRRQTITVGDKPIFTMTLGQGLSRVIHPSYVEYTEDIICQKFSVRCLNAALSDFIFEIEGSSGKIMQVNNGDTVTLRRVSYFFETHYRIVAHYTTDSGDPDTIIVGRVAISWPSRRSAPSVRSDIIALLAIQGDEKIALPPRTFWGYWARIGEGLTNELEEYRETGSLPPLRGGNDGGILRGFRNVLESGSDDQVNIIVTHLIGVDEVSPSRFRLSSRGSIVNIADMIVDMNIIYGYEYHVDPSILMYFRE
jgi:hypothetical protein